jgi:integrase
MHVPIGIVSKNLGHSSIAITLDIYVHNEKKEKQLLFSRVKFFETIRQNFKKFLQSIITHYV